MTRFHGWPAGMVVVLAIMTPNIARAQLMSTCAPDSPERRGQIGCTVFPTKPVTQNRPTADGAFDLQARNASAKTTQIVLLGTGTPSPDPDRSGPATALVVNGTPYLIDFGPGVVRRIAAASEKGVAGLSVVDV